MVLYEVIVSLDNLGVPVYKIDPSVRSESVCAEPVRVVDRWPELEDLALLSSEVEEVPEETVYLDNSGLVVKAEVNSVKAVMLWPVFIVVVENPLGLKELEELVEDETVEFDEFEPAVMTVDFSEIDVAERVEGSLEFDVDASLVEMIVDDSVDWKKSEIMLWICQWI